MLFRIYFLSLILLIPFVSFAQNPGKSYNDGHGTQVYLPNGNISFADEVLNFTKGNPAAIVQSSKPVAALGIPDYDGVGKGFISLGCGGSLIVRFTDNALINIDGPDLYIFEVGKYIESTELSISKDAINWISIGTIDGAKAEVDIAPFTNKEDVFSYVRLVDLRTECKGMWSGADIDAIAAIGAAKRVSITGTILFNLNESVLKPDAKKVLDELTTEINQTSIESVLVEGYTDSLGTKAFNKKLSLTRAVAVKTYIQKKITNKQITITALVLGENNPLFTDGKNNDKNRRVEVILIPGK